MLEAIRSRWRRAIKGRRPSLTHLLAAGLWLVALIIGGATGAFFLAEPSAVGFDDGHAVAFAERLLEGDTLPFVDAICHRGPMLYWLTALFQLIGGRFEWFGLRLMRMVMLLLTTSACYGIGLAARRPLAGAVAAVVHVFVVCCALPVGPAMGVHGEPIATPFALLAVLCCTWALTEKCSTKKSTLLLVGAGISIATAGLIKQTLLPAMAPLVVWAAAVLFADVSLSRWTRLKTLGLMVAGWCLPLLLVLLIYAFYGALGEFWYWSITYNADVYMGPYADVQLSAAVFDWFRHNPLVALALAVLLLRPLARVVSTLADIKSGAVLARGYAAVGLEATASFLALLTLAAALAALRFWPHYFLPLVPFVALLVGLGLDAALRTAVGFQRKIGQLAAAALLMVFVIPIAATVIIELHHSRQRGQWGPARPDPLCDLIHRHSDGQEPIFIWGFDADLYITCQRKPASRFLSLTTVAGIVPPFWNRPDPKWVARGARALLAEELETIRPALVLDIPRKLGNFSIKRVPEAHAILRRDYCPLPTIKDRRGPVNAWIPRQGESCHDPGNG